jgi:acetate kinase
MDDVILVLNSGSSSIKFSVFVEHADQMKVKFKGQLEGLYSSPQFLAKNAAGAEIGAHNWGEGTKLGHEGAVAYLTEFLSRQREENRLIAVGHRVVHGGHQFFYPTRITPQVLAQLEKLILLAPLHQPHNLLPIR